MGRKGKSRRKGPVRKAPPLMDRKWSEFHRELAVTSRAEALQLRADRERLRKLRLPGIKDELERAWHRFEWARDSKDHSISVLLDGLAKADEQAARGAASHAERLDRLLLTGYRKQLGDAAREFSGRVAAGTEGARRAEAELRGTARDDGLCLGAAMLRLGNQFREQIDAIVADNRAKLVSYDEENAAVRNLSRLIAERKIRGYEEQIRAVLNGYEESTERLRREHDKLKAKDDEDRRTIAEQSVRIARLTDSLSALRDQVQAARDDNRLLLARSYECARFRDAYFTAKRKLRLEQELDRERLRVMSTEFQDVVDRLQGQHLAKVQRIQTLIGLGNRLELDGDRLLVVPLSDDPLDGGINSGSHDDAGDLPSDLTQRWADAGLPKSLRKFGGLVDRVAEQVDCLRAERAVAERTSELLKESFKSYVRSITVPKIEAFDF